MPMLYMADILKINTTVNGEIWS